MSEDPFLAAGVGGFWGGGRWGGLGGKTRLVTRAKKARSALRGGQGRVPFRPMPPVGVVATIRVRRGRGMGGIGGGEGGMVGLWVCLAELGGSLYILLWSGIF